MEDNKDNRIRDLQHRIYKKEQQLTQKDAEIERLRELLVEGCEILIDADKKYLHYSDIYKGKQAWYLFRKPEIRQLLNKPEVKTLLNKGGSDDN